MTPEKHARAIADEAHELILVKYDRGQREHGGELWRKRDLLGMAIEEAVDQVIYLLTLRDQLGNVDRGEIEDVKLPERELRANGKLVYVAGPYTKPDPCANTREAIDVANSISDVCTPLIPHLSHFWHTVTPRPYEFWTEIDFVYLRRCDALLRLPGESPGSEAEIKAADEWGIPVFFTPESLRKWLAEDLHSIRVPTKQDRRG